jgi:RNA polymerase sigma-70 factor (ECF subfamily)
VTATSPAPPRVNSTTVHAAADVEHQLEQYRRELTAYCYRMLGSPFEAEDAVQDTMVRAWRGIDNFEGRAQLRSWLYRIATNVCLDMLKGRERRARPVDLGPAKEPVFENLYIPDGDIWVLPIPDSRVADPADAAIERESIRLAFVAALQHLPPRQRAALILCEVLRWQATEVAELLDTSVASVNSALQRARATLADKDPDAQPEPVLDADDKALLERYVAAFERYDIDELTSLIREDATQSMPPYDMWLAGRDDVLAWWFGPGIGCKGSRVLPAGTANGLPAYGQYKPAEGGGHEPWALMVVRPSHTGIEEFTFFLDTVALFPLFGLPLQLDT